MSVDLEGGFRWSLVAGKTFLRRCRWSRRSGFVANGVAFFFTLSVACEHIFPAFDAKQV